MSFFTFQFLFAWFGNGYFHLHIFFMQSDAIYREERRCDKCGMVCCSAAHLGLLHNRRPADAFVGGKMAMEMLRLAT